MSLESEAATDKVAKAVLADMLEASGDEESARWWRSELSQENRIGFGCDSSDGSGDGSGDGDGSGRSSGYGYSDGYGSGDGYGAGCGCRDEEYIDASGDGSGCGYSNGSGTGSGYGSWSIK